MDINIKSIIDSPINNLINTMRYSGIPLNKPESVSDHVWGMIALALEIVPRFNKCVIPLYAVDLNDIIYRIAIHDIDEAISCDIPRPFKYHSLELRNKIEEVTTEMLKERFPDELVQDIGNAKDDSIEGRIVAIFDLMQSGIKMRYEIKSGNQFIKNEVPNVIECLQDFDYEPFLVYSKEAYDYVKSIVDGFIGELKSLIE